MKNTLSSENSGLIPNQGFIHEMPLTILSYYRTAMKQIALKGMQLAVSVIKDRGVYNFTFIDKSGKELYRMVFFRGIDSPSKIIKSSKVALMPYSVKSKEDLKGTMWEIQKSLNSLKASPTLSEKVESFLAMEICATKN